MNALHPLTTLTAREYSALQDAAKARALQARSEAMDCFWRSAARRAAGALKGLRRVAHQRRATRLLEA